ncbi:MAG: transcription termination factor Rho [Candidatus Eisenbacteria bacterium]|uniref:Transcription termination factor Rho n=1 Tax=Eiseniibacteriota bacterium TaxID=2212470 RepID=A0A538TRP7_UNCEI|nr:MAG: transcription termination factor Rho [Candidatus Eisenbacteria bacterium]
MPATASGVLEVINRSGGYLRDPARSFEPGPADAFVPDLIIKRFALPAGALVSGPVQPGKQGPRLEDVESICGLSPEAYRQRTPFADLVATNPDRRFRLGGGGNVSMRIVDMIAPIGRGTRGLIVSPPKAGKTQLLEDLTIAIHADAPENRVVVLLIDERPEEVTHFRRRVPATVLASSSDQSLSDHVRVANMCMAQVRCELECGHDLVVLVDSITRMGRAFNSHGTDSGRTMSGGLDSRALEIPRKFFGMARKVENGGSVTVLATALVETGSRMDDMIFEEFKGTGNSEIVLDRSLADQRVFPAINIAKTGTRRDELLYSKEENAAINRLRRRLLDMPPRQAIQDLLKALERWPTNEELLQHIE